MQDAKLYLVKYNLDMHNLQTLSLHHFEDKEGRRGYLDNDSVDPDNTCIAMLANGRKIIIHPFKNDMAAGVEGEDSISDLSMPSFAIGARDRVMPSYTLDLTTVIQTHIVDNIIDIQFLHGYNQPTFLVLKGVKLCLDCALADFLSPYQLVMSQAVRAQPGDGQHEVSQGDSIGQVGCQCADHVCLPGMSREPAPGE